MLKRKLASTDGKRLIEIKDYLIGFNGRDSILYICEDKKKNKYLMSWIDGTESFESYYIFKLTDEDLNDLFNLKKTFFEIYTKSDEIYFCKVLSEEFESKEKIKIHRRLISDIHVNYLPSEDSYLTIDDTFNKDSNYYKKTS